ncbi:MAG: thioredoxin domain-containing protein, partial [Candidatus Rokuibacteriota bacterium]
MAWQQWGPDAFRIAKALDRPIWLDIGAIWCHWCHVMDRESYENADIAALINDNFIPVKVDRDERPDIDTRYQLAHQVINGRGGGWPLTMFLMPDGEPFAGGTYFPPDARGGMPGIRQVAPAVASAYREQRDKVAGFGRRVRQILAEFRSNAGSAGTLTPDLPLGLAKSVGAEFDSVYGGFGRDEGPKFPRDIAIRLALAEGFLTGDRGLQTVALRTLQAYARSGMRDHVNGGFYRYSVNRRLTVPHFEKMDYVQSGLLQAYLDAYRLTGDAQYAGVARDIMRYVNSTLSDHRRGGFYAHQDADTSLDDDGAYYTWSLGQLRAAVPAPAAAALRLYYDIEEPGEMESHPAQNVLRIARAPAEVARLLGATEAAAKRRIGDGTARLLEARGKHTAPLVEETKFTDRNGMMVAAYLDAYATLADPAARDFALRTLDFLLDHAVSRDGSVKHATSGERSYVEGMMGDYAGL